VVVAMSEESIRNRVYQSEEERKAAQRKILAEKFGLSVENEEEEDTSIFTTSAERTRDHLATGEPSEGTTATSKNFKAASSQTPTFDKAFTEKIDDASLKHQDTAGTPSTSDWSPLKVMNVEYEDAVLNVTQKDLVPVGRHIPKRQGVFYYENLESSEDELSETERDLRVTPITVYNSVANEYGGRRIAVNTHLISYAVKNHIRVLSRFTASKELLKGHKDEVIDLEFARFEEETATFNSGIFVLLSSGKDGFVFVWFIEVDSESSFHCVGHLTYEHPRREEGGFYRRIAFHGEEKFCKIAMADAKSSRIFVVITSNITKRLQNEPAAFTAVNVEDEPLICLEESTASSESLHMNDLLFKDADHLFSAGSDGNVYLWCISSRTLLFKYAPSTVVEPIHTIFLLRSSPMPEMMVVISSYGRNIELLEVQSNNYRGTNHVKLVSSQRITLEIATGNNDVSVSSCIDDQNEFLLLTNCVMNEMIAVHFSHDQKFYADFISRFHIRQPILSFCVTRCGRKVRYVNEDDSWEGSEINVVEELGIWCVQPKSIQYLHLYADRCRPASTFVDTEATEAGSESLTQHGTNEVVEEKAEWRLESSTKTNGSTKKSSEVMLETKAELEERNDDFVNISTATKPNNPKKKQTSGSVTRILTKQEASSQAGSTKSFQPVSILKKPSKDSQMKKEIDSSSKNVFSGRPEQSSVDTEHKTSYQPSSVEGGVDDFLQLKQQVLEEVEISCRRNFERIARQLERERLEREKLEREKLEKLLEAVSDTCNHRLEQFISSTMEREMEQTVIPRLNNLVSETFEKWMRSSHFESLMGQLLENRFGQSIDSFVRKSCEGLFESRLVPAFEAACREMLKQVDSAVVKGFQQQMEFCLKRDFLDPLSGLQEKISSVVENFKLPSTESRAVSSQENTDSTLISKEVLESQIMEMLERENYEGAFLLALGASNLDVVEWLCEKLDCHELFQSDEPPLSQVTLLSLIQQLGFDLERKTEMKMEWLKEAVMLLEPSDEMIQDYFSDILSMLLQNLEHLLEAGLNNSRLPVHLQRNIKVLLHICRSLESNS